MTYCWSLCSTICTFGAFICRIIGHVSETNHDLRWQERLAAIAGYLDPDETSWHRSRLGTMPFLDSSVTLSTSPKYPLPTI